MLLRVKKEIKKSETFNQSKILQSVALDIICETCESQLITEITELQKGIPDFAYLVATCNNCGQFSLVDIGPEVKNFKMKNYTIKEQLPKINFTKLQALARIDGLRSSD